MPGIALTFGVSRLVSLNGAAAWIFSAILSFVIWLIFKLKIKGFKKSFYFYIGLCVVVLAALIAIEVLTENLNVFSSISALLTGAVG
jgi:branched-subunit amino acid ABC-type transport system permease component